MIKHIVMMKLKPDAGSLMKERLEHLKSQLENLKNNVDCLDSMEVGLNLSTRPTAMDIVLVSTFKDEQALDEYRVHPEHQEVLSYIKEVVEEARVVDYWI